MRWMRSRWSAWVPWEKFSRATFMPASQSWVSISSLSQAGPMVQMILVLRIDFLLVCLAIKEGMRVGEKENGLTSSEAGMSARPHGPGPAPTSINRMRGTL